MTICVCPSKDFGFCHPLCLKESRIAIDSGAMLFLVSFAPFLFVDSWVISHSKAALEKLPNFLSLNSNIYNCSLWFYLPRYSWLRFMHSSSSSFCLHYFFNHSKLLNLILTLFCGKQSDQIHRIQNATFPCYHKLSALTTTAGSCNIARNYLCMYGARFCRWMTDEQLT